MTCQVKVGDICIQVKAGIMGTDNAAYGERIDGKYLSKDKTLRVTTGQAFGRIVHQRWTDLID